MYKLTETIKSVSFNATTLYQMREACPGAWLDVCATMFRVDRGLRPGLALDCHRQPRQWPLRPLLPGAITGHLWQPCHGNEGRIGKQGINTTAWWFMIDISIRRTSQLYDRD